MNIAWTVISIVGTNVLKRGYILVMATGTFLHGHGVLTPWKSSTQWKNVVHYFSQLASEDKFTALKWPEALCEGPVQTAHNGANASESIQPMLAQIEAST